jgi:hypothetical protein
MKLEDTDKMPFGLHKGKLMQDVPVWYLHYLWTNGIRGNMREDAAAVADYIARSLNALKLECPDKIWD